MCISKDRKSLIQRAPNRTAAKTIETLYQVLKQTSRKRRDAEITSAMSVVMLLPLQLSYACHQSRPRTDIRPLVVEIFLAST